MRQLLLFALIAPLATGIFFGGLGGGGGGGGCGCGCQEDTSCLPKPPKIGCQKLSFSVPTIKLPCPSAPSCGCGGCGGRKKREAAGDDKCTVPELSDIIINGLRNSPKESRDNILAAMKEKFTDQRYLVSCVDGKSDFKTTTSNYCSAGTAEQTCFIIQAVDHE